MPSCIGFYTDWLEIEEMNGNAVFHLIFSLVSLISFHSLPAATGTSTADENLLRKTYIVRVQTPLNLHPKQWLGSFLSTPAGRLNMPCMVYTYKNAISGFTARLTEGELAKISASKGFISAHPDRLFRLQTTHTPEFLGLHPDASHSGRWRGVGGGDSVVIAVLDTGVFPDHPSFSGAGMPPPPAKWKGRCDFNASQCNNKLIGARTFLNGEAAARGLAAESVVPAPPIDEHGHGTHTASTAAGAMVEDAQLIGNAKGLAAGIAPRAHLAIYKVCRGDGCYSSDILAAMDAAVEDGVDVLSLSLGLEPLPFFQDEVAIGAFHATKKGIFVSCAGGNVGPARSTLLNEAPWMLTVAASSTDRTISASVKLGNGAIFSGESANQVSNFTQTQLPLIYAGAGREPNAAFCISGSLDGLDVTGKVVLCDRGTYDSVSRGRIVRAAGGAAMVIANQERHGYSTKAEVHTMPASHISFSDGSEIKAYINSSRTPTASILFKGTLFGSRAPAIASFSSRGPSIFSPSILKPDITGPGLNVLAAWPFPVGPPTSKPFNIISGTSMSTPHLAGIAALIKSAHPSWSAAAIKSAIMTTAETVDRNGRRIQDERGFPASHFALGAGHVNPTKAINPGLIYDIDVEDYTPYLCGLNYSSKNVSVLTGKVADCPSNTTMAVANLNYPSISVFLRGGEGNVTIWRTVKNVGEARADYVVKVEMKGVLVAAEPSMLKFEKIGDQRRFALTFKGHVTQSGIAEGRVRLISSKYEVNSPIVITF